MNIVIYKYIHTDTHTHTHIYIYIYKERERSLLTQWTKFEQTPGDSGGQRNLAGYSLWGHK